MTVPRDPVVIVGYARTPIGNFRGCLKSLTASDLGVAVIKAVLERSRLPAQAIDEVLMGCVLTAGIGQAPARQAALGAGLPDSIGCTTINKMCGSGMKAVMLGHDLIKAGTAKIVVAGGMESMSNAPYIMPKARDGLRLGHGHLLDHLFIDGLEDPSDHRLMGCFAEDCAESYNLTRNQQDDYAKQSLFRALKAMEQGRFDQEIEPLTIKAGNGKISEDEQPGLANADKISRLKPAFKQDGTVTAANSSSISDGAAAVVLMAQAEAERLGVKSLATVLAHQTHAQQPALFTTAPSHAIRKLLGKLEMQISDIDLFEINEAFSVVALAAMKELELPPDKLNVHGGACALGHPIGASGARILVTLISALQQYDLHRGIASICIGGGEATAMAIER